MFAFRRLCALASRPLRRLWIGPFLWLGLGLAGGCRSSGAGRDAAAEPRAACASACAALVTSGCDREGQRPRDQARCVEACLGFAAQSAGARCGSELAAYLGCVGGSRLDCASTSPASVCLEHGEGVAACTSAFARLGACLGPCTQAGVSHVVDRGAAGLRAEIVRAGCASCGELRPGTAPGARCEAASVCAETCCTCPDGRARYRVRACMAGECAASEVACREARRLSPRDPCAL